MQLNSDHRNSQRIKANMPFICHLSKAAYSLSDKCSCQNSFILSCAVIAGEFWGGDCYRNVGYFLKAEDTAEIKEFWNFLIKYFHLTESASNQDSASKNTGIKIPFLSTAEAVQDSYKFLANSWGLVTLLHGKIRCRKLFLLTEKRLLMLKQTMSFMNLKLSRP